MKRNKKDIKRAILFVAGAATICFGIVAAPQMLGGDINLLEASAAENASLNDVSSEIFSGEIVNSEQQNTDSSSLNLYYENSVSSTVSSNTSYGDSSFDVNSSDNSSIYESTPDTSVSSEPFTSENESSSPVSSEDVVKIEKIALNYSSLDLGKGKRATLVAKITPENATAKISWSSSNEAVAKVGNDGVVTAVGHGTAVITAKSGDVTASCKIICEPSLKFETLGASIRVSRPYGLRFGIQLQKDEEYSMTDILEYGTILLPSNMLAADEELTLNTEKVQKIKAVNILSETQSSIVYTGVLINIPQSQFTSEITGRGYLIYRDADGNAHTIYSNVADNSFKGVAIAAHDKYSKLSNPSFAEKLTTHRLEAILNGGTAGGLIYLSPSRQSNNEYACGNTTEYEQMYRVAAVVERYLKDAGFNVHVASYDLTIYTRDEDAANRGAACYVAIHSNAFNHYKRGTLALAYSKLPNSTRLTYCVYNRVAALTPNADEGVKGGDKYIEIHQPGDRGIPSTLVEVEYHDSNAGAIWIMQNIENLGREIAYGIMEYMLA